MKYFYVTLKLFIILLICHTTLVFSGENDPNKQPSKETEFKATAESKESQTAGKTPEKKAESVIALYITKSSMHMTIGHSKETSSELILSVNNADEPEIMLQSPAFNGSAGAFRVFDYMLKTWEGRIKQVFSQEKFTQTPVLFYIAAPDIEGLNGANSISLPDDEDIKQFIKGKYEVCRSKNNRSEFFGCMFKHRIMDILPEKTDIKEVIEEDGILMAAISHNYLQKQLPSDSIHILPNILMVHISSRATPYLVIDGKREKRTRILPQEKEEKGGLKELGLLFSQQLLNRIEPANREDSNIISQSIQKEGTDLEKAIYSDKNMQLASLPTHTRASKKPTDRGLKEDLFFMSLLNNSSPNTKEILGNKVAALARSNGRYQGLCQTVSTCKYDCRIAHEQSLRLVEKMHLSLLDTIVTFIYWLSQERENPKVLETFYGTLPPVVVLIGEHADLIEQCLLTGQKPLSYLFLEVIQSNEYINQLWQTLESKNFISHDGYAGFLHAINNMMLPAINNTLLLSSHDFMHFIHQGALVRLNARELIKKPNLYTQNKDVPPTPLPMEAEATNYFSSQPQGSRKRSLSPEGERPLKLHKKE